MKKYVTKQGDTWSTIAFSIYGDETKAQTIMEERANLLLLDTEVFPAGVDVLAPDIDEDGYDVVDLPAWRKPS